MVNDPVNCEASAANTIHQFEWYPYYKGWTFEDNIGTSKILNNLKFKPAEGKMPESNSDFGDKYGTILLKCTDKKGNVMGVMSSLEIKNEISSDPFNMFNRWRPMNSNKAKVFFHKNDEIIDDDPLINGGSYTINSGLMPQWLYYWRQVIPRSKHIAKVRWSKNIPGSFAGTGRPSRVGLSPAKIGTTFTPATTSVQDEVGNSEIPIRQNSSTKYKVTGIYAVYATMIHESWHADFIVERWPNGYDPSNDKEETGLHSKSGQNVYGDYYPDSPWEKESKDGFRIDVDDYFGRAGSVGFNYEELKADNQELDKYERGVIEYSKSLDWSYEKDLTKSLYQGKQWNK